MTNPTEGTILQRDGKTYALTTRIPAGIITPEQTRESLEFDIVYVGAGPANLASAIHLQRLIKRCYLQEQQG